MRQVLVAVLCIACVDARASAEAVVPRTLVHGFPATGPVEVTGTVAANKVLRTVQHYAVPAWSDALATHVAHILQDASDPPVLVVRKPRQAGFEAARLVAKAPPDGKTLLLASRPPDRVGLQRVGVVATMPYVLVIHADAAKRPLRALLQGSGATAGKALVATTGAQTVGHAALDALRRQYGDVQPVAYNGGHAALQAAVASHVIAAFVPLASMMPYLSSGRVRVAAVADLRRHPGIPNVGTTVEAGIGELQAVGWFEIFAPADVPPKAALEVARLLDRVDRSGEVNQTFFELGLRLEYRGVEARLQR